MENQRRYAFTNETLPAASSNRTNVLGTNLNNVHIQGSNERMENQTRYAFTTETLPSESSHQTNVLYPNLNNLHTQRSNEPERTPSAPARAPSAPAYVPSAPPLYEQEDAPVARNPERSTANIQAVKEGICPICRELFSERIYQCGEGHSACHRCLSGGRVCECGRRVTDMRNIPVEHYVQSLDQVRRPCPNERCKLRLPREDLQTHLAECIFRIFDCPLAQVYGICSWKGRREMLVSHLEERHAETRRATVGSEVVLKLQRSDERIVHVVSLNPYLFCVDVKVSQASQTLHMAVQQLGTKHGASKWQYKINFYNKDEPKRKLEYEDAVTSDTEKINDIFANYRCLTLPLSYVKSLTNARGLIHYKFYITKQNSDTEKKQNVETKTKLNPEANAKRGPGSKNRNFNKRLAN